MPIIISNKRNWFGSESDINIPSTDFHLDATTLQLNDEENVTNWDDRNNSGLTLTATRGSTITYSDSAVNNQPAINFAAGLLQSNSGGHVWDTHEATIFLVATPSSVAQSYIISSTGGAGSPAILSQFNSPYEWFNSQSERLSFGSGLTGFNVLTAIHDSAAGDYVTTRANGAEVATVGAITSNFGGSVQLFGIGNASNGNNQYQGQVAELIGYKRVLDEQELTDVENYLLNKYGL